MPKAEWGAKHLCICGAKFYDLRNPTAACPKCGTVAERGRRDRAATATEEEEKRKAPPGDEAKDGIESGEDLADDEDASPGKDDGEA